MKISDLLIAVIMCILWSSDYIITKKALEHFSPLFFSSIRFSIVAICVLPFCRRFPPCFKTLAIIGFALVVLTYGCIDIAIQMNSSVGVANFVVELAIVVSIIGSYFFLNERLRKTQIIGVVVAFCGLILIVFANSNPPENALLDSAAQGKKNLISMVFLFISIFAWPSYTIISKRLENRIHFKEIIGWTALFGSIPGFIASFIFENGQVESLLTISLNEMFFLIYAGICGVILPHIIWHTLANKYGVCKISLFSLLIPIITTLFGFMLLGENIGTIAFIGGLIILLGLYVVETNSVRKLA